MMRSLRSCTWWLSPDSDQPGSALPLGDSCAWWPNETLSRAKRADVVVAWSSHSSEYGIRGLAILE